MIDAEITPSPICTSEDSGARTRTGDLRFMNPLPETITDENATTYNAADSAPATYPDSWDGKSPLDPGLAAVVAAWSGLPDAVKRGIVAMVEAAGSQCE